MEFSNNAKEVITTPQSLYDAFNDFMFSNDTRVIGKLIARTTLFNQIKDIPGDIIECGVFRGSGILTWLKLKKILAPNAFKKIIGFDFFDSVALLETLSDKDHERMKNLFDSRPYKFDNAFLTTFLKPAIYEAGFNDGDFELIKGNISVTASKFVKLRPGAKISLLYMDLDVEVPTYTALEHLWPLVSKGGLVVFDEYAYHQWSETKGADRFAEENNLTIKPLNYNAPTAYIQK